jgi:hypothetical protein
LFYRLEMMLLAYGGMLSSAPLGANAMGGTVHQKDGQSEPEFVYDYGYEYAQLSAESASEAMAAAEPPRSYDWDEPIEITFSNDSD